MDADRCWQRLRWLRANPPGHASKNRERRQTFTTALEQAEQLVRSASHLGPETRPINLFYGLSQGTRAVAAALEPDDKRFWLSNHGIDHRGSLDRSTVSIQVQQTDAPGGSFTALARLLRSPGLPNPVDLGDLLAALPLHLPDSSWSDRPRAIAVQHVAHSGFGVIIASPYVFARTGNWPPNEELRNLSIEASRRLLSEYINEHYPSLRGAEPRPDFDPQLIIGNSGMQFCLKFEHSDHVGSEVFRQQALEARTIRVGDQWYALPAFVSEDRSCHPTIILWAVLWTLSMLSRYSPTRWAKALNVDSNRDATALEEVLQDSLSLIPWALLDALDELPDWSSL
ncbi:YaaC family protein [Terrabacter sp. 2TAF16]|uniref:YaaC family protein n=1 Tax=Terrabacter sp. 2TAF16 TaxID=3233008 RepID=UPI003F95D99C